MYAVDWDNTTRRQRVTVTGNAPVDITTAFNQGAWMTFPITVGTNGVVNITIDRTAGPNALLFGVFLGDAGPPATPPPPPPPPYTSAPQGNWVNTYGSQGYVLGGWNNGTSDAFVLPGATFTVDQGSRVTWSNSTTDVRALQDPANPTGPRHAGVIYHGTQIRAHLDFANAFNGKLRLYMVDWDNTTRRQRVTVSGKAPVDITTAFNQGAWMTFDINVGVNGRVDITIDRTAGPNAVLFGVFLGDGGAPPNPP